ncbi:MAG: TIM barrel protein [Pseudomonadales bacterium]
MTRIISLASGTLPEFGPVEVTRSAAGGGFNGCGIWFDAETWDAATTREVGRAFAETGLRPLEIEVIDIRPGPPNPEHQRLLECGSEIGATEAIVVSSDPDLEAVKGRFAALCEIGDRLGINLCLEFLPIYQVKTLTMALEVLRGVGHPRGKLLIDPLHVARAGATVADVAALDDDLFSFAQFCDAPMSLDGEPGFEELLEEALDGRSTPGAGGLPLRELLGALPPELPLSLELRSRPLRERFPDPVDRARHVYQETALFLG